MCFFKKLILPIVVGFMCMSFSLQAQAILCDQSFVLVAGQSIPVGTVNLTFDNGDLTVVIDTSGTGWFLGITHVHAGDQVNIFPVNKNNLPKVGQFSSTVDGNQMDTLITHLLSNIETNTDGTIVVAVHAEVFKKDDLTGPIIQEESAWAVGTFFNETKNWSQYITCEVPPPPPPTNICPQICKDTIDVGVAVTEILIQNEDAITLHAQNRCSLSEDVASFALKTRRFTESFEQLFGIAIGPAAIGSDQILCYSTVNLTIGEVIVRFYNLPLQTTLPPLTTTQQEVDDCLRYLVQQVNAAFDAGIVCEP